MFFRFCRQEWKWTDIVWIILRLVTTYVCFCGYSLFYHVMLCLVKLSVTSKGRGTLLLSEVPFFTVNSTGKFLLRRAGPFSSLSSSRKSIYLTACTPLRSSSKTVVVDEFYLLTSFYPDLPPIASSIFTELLVRLGSDPVTVRGLSTGWSHTGRFSTSVTVLIFDNTALF